MRTPFLSTGFSESGERVKKRIDKILNTKKKKVGGIIILFGIILLSILGTVFSVENSGSSVGIIGGSDGPISIYVSKNNSENTTLSEAISKKLLEDARSGYWDGEVAAEGHIILDVSYEKNEAYLLTMQGNYGFVNGKMSKISGSGVIPAVAYFAKDEEKFSVTSLKYPKDGSYYTKSIKEMFPTKLHKKVLSDGDAEYNALKAQERVYVTEYLKKIGRNAEIVDHESGPLLTDLGVSVEISNKLLEIKMGDLHKYPYFVGNQEYIENGIRVVYQMDYKEGDSEAVYQKTEYDTKKLLEEIKIDVTTGEIVSLLNTPKQCGYLVDIDNKKISVDIVEYIDSANTKRIAELGLDFEDMPDGYYIHNPDTTPTTYSLTDKTEYYFFDWKEQFEERNDRRYVLTNDVETFIKYINSYNNSTPGMPFFFEIKNGEVLRITEELMM